MNREQEIVDLGSRFGNEAVEHIARRAEAYCECERERMELTNQPRIIVLHLEGKHLANHERVLVERLQRTAPPLLLPSRRRRARYYWAVGIILAVAAFFFSLVAFAPYRLGWTGILYCVGVAIATPFAVEEFLEAWKSDSLFKMVVTAVFCAAVVGGCFLAAIRGDLLAQQVDQSDQAVVIDNAPAPSTPKPQNAFYESTRNSLRLLMLLFAVAIDLGAGVAVHRARLLGATSGEDYAVIFKELHEVRERLGEVVYEITALTNAPALFVAGFWRDFYRAMLTQTMRKALTKFLGLPLYLLLAMSSRSDAQQPLNIVAGLDLSTSEAVKRPDQKTPFSRNVDGMAHLLATVPAGANITVIGITANSFAQPYVLLSANVPMIRVTSASDWPLPESISSAPGRSVRARLPLTRGLLTSSGRYSPRARYSGMVPLALATFLFSSPICATSRVNWTLKRRAICASIGSSRQFKRAASLRN